MPLALTVLLIASACTRQIEPFSPAFVDRTVSSPSEYPIAAIPGKVGQYQGSSKSGAGYFYDDVLEYRVWMHPENGTEPLAGHQDYFAAFAQYESALKFSRAHPGAEPPLALIRQIESVNEPTPGVFEWTKEERITEWKVEWLTDSHREADSIPKFLSAHSVPENQSK